MFSSFVLREKINPEWMEILGSLAHLPPRKLSNRCDSDGDGGVKMTSGHASRDEDTQEDAEAPPEVTK